VSDRVEQGIGEFCPADQQVGQVGVRPVALKRPAVNPRGVQAGREHDTGRTSSSCVCSYVVVVAVTGTSKACDATIR